MSAAAATRIFLRHGQCAGNVARVLVAPDDSPLTPLGEAQARAAADGLCGTPLKRILTSPLLRARQTTAIVASAFPEASVEVLPALRERSFGELDSWPVDAVKASPWAHCRSAWRACPPGGETLAEVAARVVAELAIWSDPEPLLVVAHAGVIRAVVGLLDGRPTSHIGRLRVPHAKPWTRHVRQDRWARLGV